MIKIIPKDKKLLKSKKVIEYFKHIESKLEEKFKETPVRTCPCCGCVMMEIPK